MPYYYTRICPICQKVGVQDISGHLRFAHKLSSEERKPYLSITQYHVRNGENVHTNVMIRKMADSKFRQVKQRDHTLNSKPAKETSSNKPNMV